MRCVSTLRDYSRQARTYDVTRGASPSVLGPLRGLALVVFTREDIERTWFTDYFPASRAWMLASHPPLAELLPHLPGARRIEVTFRDLEDAYLAALAAHPELVVDPRWHRQTSYFERLERDHADELRVGLARLRDELAAGRAPRTPGTATALAYRHDA